MGTSTMAEHGCQGRRKEEMVVAATMMSVVIVGGKEVVWERVECGRSAGMPMRRRPRSPRPKNDKNEFSKSQCCGILRQSECLVRICDEL